MFYKSNFKYDKSRKKLIPAKHANASSLKDRSDISSYE